MTHPRQYGSCCTLTFIFNLSSGFAAENIPFSPQPPEIHAGSWVLMDYTTGQILTAG
ncbi:hypothetical protein ACV2X1_24805, partial [Escherichia coli]